MITVVLFFFLLWITYAVRKQIKARSTYKLPPSFPGELPITGHTHILIVSGTKDLWSFIKKLTEFAAEKGGIIYFRILRDLYYVITDPEDALTVANSCLQKPFVYDFAKNWVGQGLITATGDTNKRHRKLMGSQFTAPAVHTFMKVFNENSKKLVAEINSFSNKGPFDPSSIIKHIVLETSCLTTFGSKIKDTNFIQNYGNAVHEMLRIYTNRFTTSYLQSDFIYGLLGHQKKEDILVNTLTKLTNKVIQQKKAAMKNYNINDNCPDLLNNEETTHKSLADHLVELDGLLTDREIKEELDTNIIASYDTVSHTLINTMVLLGSHPEIQDRIYKELIEVLGVDKDVEKNDLQKLVYTKAVIKETLRILPTAPIFARYIDKEVKLKNYTLPAKSLCLVAPYGIHRSPAWGPDAEQFKPERWLDPVSLPSNINSFAAFSMGKRSCIGMTYGITLLTVILAHLVRQFKWTADFTKVKMQFLVTLQPTEGHDITIERRTINQ